MCVTLKGFQDLSVGKMAVEVSVPCFVSRCLTLGMIIKTSASQKCVSKHMDLHDDLLLSCTRRPRGTGQLPQAAGLMTLTGTFDAGVRLEGIVDDQARVIHWGPAIHRL